MNHNQAANPVDSNQRNLILGLVVILWLGGTGIMLWWFQSKQIRPFITSSDNPVTVQASYLQQRLTPILARAGIASEQDSSAVQKQNSVTLVHFWNPDCLCNQLSQRHFDALLAAHSKEELRILVLAPANTSDSQIQSFEQLNGERMQVLKLQPDEISIPASPALALMHGNGQLGYFGAWGFGALCSLESDDFFPSMVRKMLAGPYGPFVNIAGSGCFCEWP